MFSLFRLDYSGIALLIMGSFVPWLYYSFYCSPQPRLIYLTIVCVLGIAAIVVAQWDRFSTPRHRPTRAGGQSLISHNGGSLCWKIDPEVMQWKSKKETSSIYLFF